MTCEERRDFLLLYVAGALEPAEAEELREHLGRGCVACAGALAEAEATFHAVPAGLGAVAAPDGAWEKIESRVALKEQMVGEAGRDRAALAQPLEAGKKVNWMGLSGWAAAAVVGIVLGLEYGLHQNKVTALQAVNAGLEKQRQTDLASFEVQRAAFEKELRDAQVGTTRQLAAFETRTNELQARLDKVMRSEEYAVASTVQPEATGKLFWDKSENTWTLYAAKVAAPGAGKTYQLWGITDTGEKMPMATTEPDASGKLVMQAAVPTAPAGAKFVAVAFTDEPTGGLAKPTGQVQLLASLVK